MELTLEQELALARARARKRAAEAQAEGRPWEKFKSQDEDLKPWERATRQQDEAQQKPSESDIDEEFLWARARKRRAESGKPQPVPDGLEIDVARA